MAILTYANSFAELQALFQAAFGGAWSTIVQNAPSPATQLYVSLHNNSPGPTGSQTTNETPYTNYTRTPVARSAGGWTVTQGSGSVFSSVVNAVTIGFPACGVSGDTITHWGVGLASSGSGTLLAYGPVGPVAGPAVPFSCNQASPGVITCPGFSPSTNDRVSVWQLPGTEGLPTGFNEGTVYFAANVGANTLTLSTTTGNGNPVNTSTIGSGVIYKQTPLVVASGITPSFAAGAFSIQKA